MQISVYSIEKKEEYASMIEGYIKQSKAFAQVKNITIFNNKIAKASDPKRAYSEAFEEYLQGYTIALTPEGKLMESETFAKLLEDKAKVNFFIGGAYGFEENFKERCDLKLSLTPMTTSHKVAKIFLFEQIYRALSINFNHPYHKG